MMTLGWTPSSFVSSRVKKADYSRQKPEDFMDQEVNEGQSTCSIVLGPGGLTWSHFAFWGYHTVQGYHRESAMS